MKIKKGDLVAVIAGKDKGKKGKIMDISPKSDRVTIENVNIVSRHKKPRSAQDKGGIVKKPAPVDASNVMIVCPSCGKATRISHKILDGKKVRVCKKCGESLDKEMAKVVKKENKTTTKAEPVKKVAPAAVKAPAKKASPAKTAEKKATTASKPATTKKPAAKKPATENK